MRGVGAGYAAQGQGLPQPGPGDQFSPGDLAEAVHDAESNGVRGGAAPFASGIAVARPAGHGDQDGLQPRSAAGRRRRFGRSHITPESRLFHANNGGWRRRRRPTGSPGEQVQLSAGTRGQPPPVPSCQNFKLPGGPSSTEWSPARWAVARPGRSGDSQSLRRPRFPPSPCRRPRCSRPGSGQAWR